MCSFAVNPFPKTKKALLSPKKDVMGSRKLVKQEVLTYLPHLDRMFTKCAEKCTVTQNTWNLTSAKGNMMMKVSKVQILHLRININAYTVAQVTNTVAKKRISNW